MKRKYELMFALDAVLDDNQVEEIANKIKGAIESREGDILIWNRWGKRRFAYEIEGRTHGVYYLTEFSIAPSKITELELALKLNEAVLRHLLLSITTRMEKLIARQNILRSKLHMEVTDRTVKVTAADVALIEEVPLLSLEDANETIENLIDPKIESKEE